MGLLAIPLLAVALLATGPGILPAQDTSLSHATELLRSGRYDEALPALRALGTGAEALVASTRAYARALMEVGQYQEARELLVTGDGEAADRELENVLGETLAAVGRDREAEAAFRRSMAGEASDRNVARLNLGILLWNRGERDEALEIFDAFIDLYNGSRASLSAEELMAVGTAVRYLGVTDPALYQDALMAFDDAAERDPGDPRPDLLAGELFLEKYRATDAREAFRPVLDRNPRHPRALLGQAKILDFEGAGGSVGLVREALDVNPRYVEALAFLAELYLKTEDYERAREEIDRALGVNPNDLQTLSVLAAAHFLGGDTLQYRAVRDRVRGLNPAYGGIYVTLAEAAVTQRQYRTAVELARTALEMEPSSWRAYGVLGMNQLRVGEVEEGRENLETAFQGDPYNPWYKNSLDLLDTFHRFEVVSTPNFQIYVRSEEAELLGPYVGAVAEEAFSALRERYGASPPTPIRLELYSNHADFSVRTLGLTGLGALGVSFGSTLVMDSPSALEPGAFNWASTLWHETAHAFHLAMSEHRVPRWFTEGLAVHEQHKARSRWGHKASPAWLQAYAAGRLHPVSHLNEGFIRPEYPQQVPFSYFQASVVFDLIESRWGFDAVLAMLDGYRRGHSNERVFQEVLGESPQEFDEIFDEFVRDRWGGEIQAVATHGDASGSLRFRGEMELEDLRRGTLERPGSFHGRLAYGQALYRADRYDEAEVELKAALALFPEYGGSDGPYFYLARIHQARGETELAARALHQLGLRGETHFQVHLEEAGIWMELGDTVAAAEALEKAVEIVPGQVEPHQRLAALYEAMGRVDGAVRERRAILALDPVNRAEAHFRLARALLEAGNAGEARSQVLRALELAPSYEPALELLLDLQGIGDGRGGDKQMGGGEMGDVRMGDRQMRGLGDDTLGWRLL